MEVPVPRYDSNLELRVYIDLVVMSLLTRGLFSNSRSALQPLPNPASVFPHLITPLRALLQPIQLQLFVPSQQSHPLDHPRNSINTGLKGDFISLALRVVIVGSAILVGAFAGCESGGHIVTVRWGVGVGSWKSVVVESTHMSWLGSMMLVVIAFLEVFCE